MIEAALDALNSDSSIEHASLEAALDGLESESDDQEHRGIEDALDALKQGHSPVSSLAEGDAHMEDALDGLESCEDSGVGDGDGTVDHFRPHPTDLVEGSATAGVVFLKMHALSCEVNGYQRYASLRRRAP